VSADFSRVKAAALSRIDDVLSNWLPGGKRQGREYLPLNPTRSDSKPGSFSINLDTGTWSDFATGDKGGDLVALVAYIDGIKQGEAAKCLAAFLGLDAEKTDAPQSPTSAQKHPSNTQASTTSGNGKWVALQPVPTNASEPPRSHYQQGKPSMRWCIVSSPKRRASASSSTPLPGAAIPRENVNGAGRVCRGQDRCIMATSWRQGPMHWSL
jgi:hypothetical protein